MSHRQRGGREEERKKKIQELEEVNRQMMRMKDAGQTGKELNMTEKVKGRRTRKPGKSERQGIQTFQT